MKAPVSSGKFSLRLFDFAGKSVGTRSAQDFEPPPFPGIYDLFLSRPK